MKTTLLAGVSLGALAIAVGAQAADLSRPVYKAPVAAPAWYWTGFYVGGTFGGVWARSTVGNDPASAFGGYFNPFYFSDFTTNGAGVIGGAEAGYNWQVANWVLGLEVDFSGSSLNHTVASPYPFLTDTFQTRLNWLSTVRGRIGYASNGWLVYGTGGAAFASLKDSYYSTPLASVAAPRSTVAGWTVGGGVEYALTDHWTVKAEYLHVGFENRTATDTSGFGYIFDFRDRVDIGRVGINYKF
jgi:outer membrane immunogenic protein